MKRISLVLLLLLVVGAVFAAIAYYSVNPSPPRVDTARVERGDIEKLISASGKVDARNQYVVSATVGGLIVDLPLADGALVKKDQVLAEIDPNPAARSETPDPDIDEDRHRVVRAPARGLLFYERAPVTPSSSSRVTSVGQVVSPGQILFSIADFRTLVFEAAVDEADISKVKAGQTADVILDAFPDQTFPGTVRDIAKTASTTQSGGTAFKVRVNFSAPGRVLRLGMSGSADITESKKDGVLKVPFEAIQGSARSPYVFLVRDDVLERRSVRLGLSTDTEVEITSGLAEGDEVVVSDTSGLKDGERVRVVDGTD